MSFGEIEEVIVRETCLHFEYLRVRREISLDRLRERLVRILKTDLNCSLKILRREFT